MDARPTNTPEPSSPRAPIPGLPGRIFAWLYAKEIARRNRAFDARKGVVELDRPVLSIGNLSVGGTGKTPMVRHVTQWLLAEGFDPCIAMRGYASSTGSQSDEALEYQATLPGVPIVAQPNRVEGLIQLFSSPRGRQVDCIVLDDGFQHRKIQRQCDIVLLDATRDAFRDRLLPAGMLREPPASLARAHAVVLTHARGVAPADLRAMQEAARQLAPSAVHAACEHRWAGLVDQHGAAHELHTLRGTRILAACAIGNPGPFLATCRELAGAPNVTPFVLADHDSYAPATIEKLLRLAHDSRAASIVTTQKDWSKLARVIPSAWPVPVLRPHLLLEFLVGEENLRALVLASAKEGQSLRSLMDLPDVDDAEPQAREATPG